MTTQINFYGKHKMWKTENPIIFTCCENESYISCFTFANNKRVLFSALTKGLVIVLMLLGALFFGMCEFFYFLIRINGTK
jgi:hypothetical protein